jgi:hypothetical protein
MIQINNERLGFAFIIAISLFVLIGILIQGPIAQDVNYHLFKDTRTIWNIPNFWNVVSNTPLLVIGILGVYKVTVAARLKIIDEIKIAYIFLFLSTSLVGIGSGYYHLSPNNETLVWDRLPMAISFMALFTITITEFISVRVGKALLLPLVLAGISSVVYWHFSEARGEGDLRYYALVQLLPMLVSPVILIFFRSQFTRVHAYWWLLIAYLLAKFFEYFDVEIFNMLGLISGHSIKHIAAAFGLFVLLMSYERRSLI